MSVEAARVENPLLSGTFKATDECSSKRMEAKSIASGTFVTRAEKLLTLAFARIDVIGFASASNKRQC